MTQLFSRLTATHSVETDSQHHRHLGWLMLALLGMGATIGAGIFVMPGRIASLAGPAGMISIAITSLYFCAIGNRYERFSVVVPHGVSAYSYTYHTLGELAGWVVGWGLFIEYFMGTAAVAIGFSEYLRTALNLGLPDFLSGWSKDGRFGVDIVAVACIATITVLLVRVGTHKPAWMNAILVGLKLFLLALFICVGATSVNSENWHPFLPVGWNGVMQGAALFVFPFVGFDALYTFARESKSLRDTKIATFVCVLGVAILYLLVFLVLTGLSPSYVTDSSGAMIANPLFSGDESAAPLAKVLIANGHTVVAKMIAVGAVIGLFNVVFVMIQGAPRIFRSMAEDRVLPHHFENLNFGIIVTGTVCAFFAAVVPFAEISEMMVLGTLIAFLAVGIGSLRLPNLTAVDILSASVVCVGSAVLVFYLNPMVLKVYLVSCPIGLLIYFALRARRALENEAVRNSLVWMRKEATGVWSMCWPIVVTMFVTSFVDTINAKAASLIGAHEQTAVAVVDQINFSFVLFLMALGIGINAVLARAKGADDTVKCQQLVQNAIRLSLAAGATTALISIAIAPQALPLLIHNGEVRLIGNVYTIFGALHLLPYALICMLSASMRSLGDAKTPMYGVLLSGAITCALSLTVATVPPLRSSFGVFGIGMASMIGSISGSTLIISKLRLTAYGSELRIWGSVSWQFVKQVCSIGVPAGLQRLTWALSLIGQLAVVAIAGLPETVSTAMTVGLRVESLFFLPTWAASFGVAALVGNALGAGDRDRAFKMGWVTTALSFSTSIVSGLTLYFSAPALAVFMSDDPATVVELTRYFQTAAFWEPFLGVLNPLTGAMQGAGETRYPMWASVFVCWVLRVPMALMLATYTNLGGLAIWLSVGFSIATNCVLIVTRYQSKRWLDTKV